MIFVSHQWLGISHPDPAGQHTSMLRQILLRLIAGSTKVEADVVSQSYGRPVEFTEKTRQQIQEPRSDREVAFKATCQTYDIRQSSDVGCSGLHSAGGVPLPGLVRHPTDHSPPAWRE